MVFIYILGLKISEDYGISIDENGRRKVGQTYVKYIMEGLGLQHPGLEYIPKIYETKDSWQAPYGMIFEIPAILIEEIFSINEKNNIFKMRHKLTFTFYFLGIIGFFFFAKEVFQSNGKAFVSCLIYSLHPRIFAHSFFNPKDIIFLSLVSMSLYPCIRFINTGLKIWMVKASIILGLAMSTRIVGIYLPFLVVLLFFGKKIIENSQYNLTELKKYVYNVFVVIILSFSVLYLTTPYYWTNPIFRFIESFFVAKNFPWTGYNFFFGEYIKASQSQNWYYIPVWFMITTPISFLAFFVYGFIKAIIDLSTSLLKNIEILFCIIGILIPLLANIILGSTLYDGWRHFFFLYAFSAVIIAFGLFQMMDILQKYWHKKYNLILLILVFIGPLYSIISIHPNQQVYFNLLAGNDPMENFEGDYWGTSYRYGFEWLSKNIEDEKINVFDINDIGWKNLWFINNKKRNKINMVRNINSKQFNIDQNTTNADYYITNFRSSQLDHYERAKLKLHPFENEVFSINIGGMKILGVYKQIANNEKNNLD